LDTKRTSGRTACSSGLPRFYYTYTVIDPAPRMQLSSAIEDTSFLPLLVLRNACAHGPRSACASQTILPAPAAPSAKPE